MAIEIDMMAEEEDFIVVTNKDTTSPEKLESKQEVDHDCERKQLRLQPISELNYMEKKWIRLVLQDN